MQRRTLFKLGIASALLQPGLRGGSLSSTGREVFAAVGRAILDKSLAAEMSRWPELLQA